MNTKTILVIIAILLAGIAGMLVYETSRPKTTGEQVGEAIDEVGNSISNAVDDATR